jgi:hypothetical protein
MDLKDLHTIMDFTRISFKELPIQVRLDGMERYLGDGERLAMCYYQAVVKYLVKKKALLNDPDLDIMLLEPDSQPEEEKYA